MLKDGAQRGVAVTSQWYLTKVAQARLALMNCRQGSNIHSAYVIALPRLAYQIASQNTHHPRTRAHTHPHNTHPTPPPTASHIKPHHIVETTLLFNSAMLRFLFIHLVILAKTDASLAPLSTCPIPQGEWASLRRHRYNYNKEQPRTRKVIK